MQTALSFTQFVIKFVEFEQERAVAMLQSEIEKFLNVSDHNMRCWVSNLEPLCSKQRKQRSATRYTTQEVLFLAVVNMLHDAGVTWKALTPISGPLFQLLRQPRKIGRDDMLVLWKTVRGWQFEGTPNPSCVTVYVPVSVARELIRSKLDDEVLYVQHGLNLGVSAVQRTRVGSR